MSKPLTGYALTSYFRKLRAKWVFTPLEAYLFFELVACCNEEGWPAEFSVSNAQLTGALGCSEQGLINARTRLKEAGVLAYTSGSRRVPTCYCFLSNGSTELSSGEVKGSTQGSTQLSNTELLEGNGSTEGSTQGSTQLTPYINKTKTKLLHSVGVSVVRQEEASLAVEQPSEPVGQEPTLTGETAPAPAKPKASRSRRRPVEPAAPPEPLPASCLLAELLNPGGLAAKVQQLAEPLTLTQAERLLADYDEAPLRTILCEMANWPKLLSGATSANLTARNWLNRRGIQAGAKQVPALLAGPPTAPAPSSFDPNALFGHENVTPEQVRARQQSGPEYAAYLAREAARKAQSGATSPTP